MTEQAESFFRTVLPPEGPYVLGYRQKGLLHKSFAQVDAMAAASLRFSEAGADVWVCIGSILDRNFVNPSNGKKVPRNQQNIKALKSLVFDIDVKEGNPQAYSSKEEAIRGLFAFQKAFELPDPTVVDSGYGFHVWWPLDSEVDPEEWTQTAVKLKFAAQVFDGRLVFDPSRVSDSCGLLRVPGTRNFKHNTTQDVKLLSLASSNFRLLDYDDAFQTYLISQKKTILRAKAKEEALETNMLALGNDEPHDFPTVLKKCGWLQSYVKTQKTASEPEWYSVLGLLPYLRTKRLDGADLAQVLSEGHPGYTIEGASKKYDQAKNNQTGPTTCEKLRSLAPSRCESCAYAHLVSTPVRLDTIDVPADAPVVEIEVVKESGEVEIEKLVVPTPPHPYYRGRDNGGIYMSIGEGEEAEVRRIYEFDIFPVRRIKDEETGNEMLEISLTLPMDGHRFIKMPNGLLTDPKKLTAALADKGVLVHPREALSLTSYIIEYARKIQKEETAHEEFARFGWRDIDGDNPRFVLGDFVVDSRGDLRRATLAPYLKNVGDVIAVKGSVEEWRRGFGVYIEMGDTLPLQFALMMGFAAPLLALTPFHGLIYNMKGESGSGKSTALKLMTSIWGKPNEHHIQVHDNRIPMFNTIGYLQSIPVAFDELTTIASDTLADIAYAISEGRGKNRADRTGNTRQNTVQWKTVVCGTSNASLYEKLGMSRAGNNAHAYRIFEVTIPVANKENRPAIDGALALVESNYGLAGRMFATYVTKNLKEVRKQVLEATVGFATKFNMPTAERFWFALFACMAVGGAIAKKLGLHDYDMEKIIVWNAKELSRIRQIVSTVEGDAYSTFSHFMQSNLRSTLFVYGEKQLQLNNEVPLYSLSIRLEFSESKMPVGGWISVPAVKEFCEKQRIEYSWFFKRLQDVGLIKGVEQKQLTAGSHHISGMTRCWVIEMNHPTMKGVIQ